MVGKTNAGGGNVKTANVNITCEPFWGPPVTVCYFDESGKSQTLSISQDTTILAQIGFICSIWDEGAYTQPVSTGIWYMDIYPFYSDSIVGYIMQFVENVDITLAISSGGGSG